MGYAISCRQCRTALARSTYLRFGEGTVSGNTAMCLGCITKDMHDVGVRDFRPWVHSCIERHRGSRRENTVLRERIAELEAKLAEVQRKR